MQPYDEKLRRRSPSCGPSALGRSSTRGDRDEVNVDNVLRTPPISSSRELATTTAIMMAKHLLSHPYHSAPRSTNHALIMPRKLHHPRSRPFSRRNLTRIRGYSMVRLLNGHPNILATHENIVQLEILRTIIDPSVHHNLVAGKRWFLRPGALAAPSAFRHGNFMSRKQMLCASGSGLGLHRALAAPLRCVISRCGPTRIFST